MQPTRIEHVNAPNMDATQRGKAIEQHQNVGEPIVQKNPATLLTTHQVTPQTLTQPWKSMFIMMTIMNLFRHLMKLFQHDNHSNQ